MSEVLKRYGIEESLSADVKLTLLEKEKQKVLRKLNHVFGDPKKERQVEEELDGLETVMAELERAGGKQLSMADVQIETRKLSQTQITFASEDEEEMGEEEAAQIEKLVRIRKLQGEVMANRGKDPKLCGRGIIEIVDFYESKGSYRSMETWLARGAQWFPHKTFLIRLYRLYKERPELSNTPEETLFYWTKRAAETGDPGACYDLGHFYIKKPRFDLKEASYCFAKAAGREYPDAYLYAFKAFYNLKDYKRAEICLLTADKMGVPGAAYLMGAMYETDENPEGKQNEEKARYWLEKAYWENPDGNVCHGLGSRYIAEGRCEEGIRLLREGAQVYRDEDCAELLDEILET